VSRVHYQGPVFCAGLALTVACMLGPRLWDDSYITLRYARSIVESHEFAFNPGDHVLGTTTPLFTVALAFLRRVSGIDLETLAFAVAVAGHAATAALIAVLGRRCSFAIVGVLAGALYAVAPLAIGPVLGGMETSAFTAAALAALMPPVNPGTTWQSIAAAAAVLLRPEGVLVAILRVLATLREGRPATLRSIALIAACTVPWFIFATWYFGSPLPHSVVAKWASASAHPSPWRASEYFLYLLLSLPFSAPMPALGLLARTTFGLQLASNLPLPISLTVRHALVLAGGACVLLVLVVGVRALCARRRDAACTLAFALLYSVSYCLADPHIFPWYLVPPLPVALLAFLAGGTSIIRLSVRSPRRRRFILAATGVALLIPAARQVRRLQQTSLNTRERAYERAVAIVGLPAQRAETVIGALEVGAIGYYSHARVLDYYGLVSAALPARGVAEMIDNYHPDYFIFHESLARFEGVLTDARFVQDYTKAATVDASVGFVHAEVQVWQRR
jgi:hypothetical protein